HHPDHARLEFERVLAAARRPVFGVARAHALVVLRVVLADLGEGAALEQAVAALAQVGLAEDLDSRGARDRLGSHERAAGIAREKEVDALVREPLRDRESLRVAVRAER